MALYLVALDGSSRSQKVLETARDLAAKQGAELVLFHAVALPTSLPPRALAMTPSDLEQDLEKGAQEELERLAAQAGVRAKIHVKLGQPWRAICEAARETSADLVFIGSHGYGGWDRLLGTTAAKVVDHLDRSVVVVKTPGG